MPGERFMFGLFNAIGETLPTMALARQAVTLAKGRSQEAVRAAADSVADQLVAMVQPFAESAFAAHRAAGRPIVLATTTPYDLVKPFADRLGLDDVVATRYTRRRRRPVRRHAVGSVRLVGGQARRGRRMGRTQWRRPRRELCLLRQRLRHAPAVGGRPPRRGEPRCPHGARRSGPSVADAQPRRVARACVKIPVIGLEVQQLAMRFARPAAYPYARFDIAGIENIPKRGAAILVGNHRSYFDVAAMSLTIAKSGRPATVPRQEGGVRRADRRVRSPPPWAASGSTAAPVRTSHCRPPPMRWPVARWWRSCRRARSPRPGVLQEADRADGVRHAWRR